MKMALVIFFSFSKRFCERTKEKINTKILIFFFFLFFVQSIFINSLQFQKKKETILYNLHQSPPPPPLPPWKSTKNTFPLRTPISARAREKEKKETPPPPFFLLKFHNPSINLLSSILFAYHVTQFRQQRIYLVPEKKTLRHLRRSRNSQPLMDPINGASI